MVDIIIYPNPHFLPYVPPLLTFYASNQMGGNKKRKQIGFYKRQRARQFVKVNRLLEKHWNPFRILPTFRYKKESKTDDLSFVKTIICESQNFILEIDGWIIRFESISLF